MAPTAVGGAGLSYGHELGHTLGLHHPWETSSIYESRLSKIEERVKYLNKYIDNTKEYADNTKIKNTNKTIGDVRNRINNEFVALEKERNDRKEFIPLHSFEKSTTENIMDYNGYVTSKGLTKHNPHTEGITFWKWQIRMIIKEVKKYHGK
ncbi:MAG: hypothetical protein JKY08_03950 [Flavobacteriaceae bacterium]|nr:hypothetical protein [Flavobacteriaceae bacterium]